MVSCSLIMYVSSTVMSRKIRFTFMLQLVSKQRSGNSKAATSSLGCVMVCFILRNTYLVVALFSGTELPKPLDICFILDGKAERSDLMWQR